MLHAFSKFILGLAAAALLLPAMANAAQVKARSGQEVGLLNISLHQNPYCRPIKPVIKIVEAPKHGSLRQVRATLDPATADSGNDHFAMCNGKAMPSLLFIYRSAAGFRGRDRVVLRLLAAEDGMGSYSFDIVVD